ncbi:MAG TPA: hypothetical protein VGQ36_07185 [Thermoanaerobaculia bacterium]|jgi:hypothetical protein|nr:hypothetical protein [Thermoanaerobaculia bacterium]
MSIWTALRRIFAEHFLYHMAIPLFIGALVEVYRVTTIEERTVHVAVEGLLNLAHIVPIAVVVVTYFVVMLFIVTHDTAPPFETANYSIVDQQLQHATRYFAFCGIPFREWFGPGPFKYFALLAAKKHHCTTSFRYDRVIVFATNRQKLNAESTILDRYHAESLATAHKELDIPMGWLGPKELRQAAHSCKKPERLKLQRIPRALSWLPVRLLSMRLWPLQLDFAVIEHEGSTKRIVLIVPFKKAETIVLKDDDASPYLTLADAIEQIVFEKGKVRKDHNFLALLGPD